MRQASRAKAIASFFTVITATAFTVAALSAATQERAGSSDHVRAADTDVRMALAEGTTRSETLRHLVGELDAADVIVYLVAGACPGGTVVACTMLSKTAGPTRLVRINFLLRVRGEPTALLMRRDALIAQIGH